MFSQLQVVPKDCFGVSGFTVSAASEQGLWHKLVNLNYHYLMVNSYAHLQ